MSETTKPIIIINIGNKTVDQLKEFVDTLPPKLDSEYFVMNSSVKCKIIIDKRSHQVVEI